MVKFIKICFLKNGYMNRSLTEASALFCIVPFTMIILQIKRKVAAVARENQTGSLRNSQSGNLVVSRISKQCVSQVSEVKQGRITKRFTHEFSRKKCRFLSALSQLDDILLKLQVRVQAGTVPGTPPNMNVENQEPTGARSLNDLHPEVGATSY